MDRTGPLLLMLGMVVGASVIAVSVFAVVRFRRQARVTSRPPAAASSLRSEQSREVPMIRSSLPANLLADAVMLIIGAVVLAQVLPLLVLGLSSFGSLLLLEVTSLSLFGAILAIAEARMGESSIRRS